MELKRLRAQYLRSPRPGSADSFGHFQVLRVLYCSSLWFKYQSVDLSNDGFIDRLIDWLIWTDLIKWRFCLNLLRFFTFICTFALGICCRNFYGNIGVWLVFPMYILFTTPTCYPVCFSHWLWANFLFGRIWCTRNDVVPTPVTIPRAATPTSRTRSVPRLKWMTFLCGTNGWAISCDKD